MSDTSQQLMEEALRATARGASQRTTVAGQNGAGPPASPPVMPPQQPPAMPPSAAPPAPEAQQAPPPPPQQRPVADRPIAGDVTVLSAQIAQLEADVRRAQRLATLCAGMALLAALILLANKAPKSMISRMADAPTVE